VNSPQLVASVAQSKGKIAEIELKIIQIDQDLSSEVAKEMREIRRQDRRIRRAQGHCRRPAAARWISAPRRPARCFSSSVHTVGGVIQPGETIMLIVPDATASRSRPRSIRRISSRCSCTRRLCCAFRLQCGDYAADRRLVSMISADITSEERPDKAITPFASPFRRRAGPIGERQAGSRHACRMLHPDGRAHGHLLPAQAAARSAHAQPSANGDKSTISS